MNNATTKTAAATWTVIAEYPSANQAESLSAKLFDWDGINSAYTETRSADGFKLFAVSVRTSDLRAAKVVLSANLSR